MALWSDPRFSDAETRDPEKQLDDAYERNGIGPAMMMMILGAGFGLLVLASVIGLGHPEQPTTLADRMLDRPAQPQPAHPLPRVRTNR